MRNKTGKNISGTEMEINGRGKCKRGPHLNGKEQDHDNTNTFRVNVQADR